jgi:hypothetical protein
MTDEEKATKDAELEEAKTLLANLQEINTNV